MTHWWIHEQAHIAISIALVMGKVCFWRSYICFWRIAWSRVLWLSWAKQRRLHWDKRASDYMWVFQIFACFEAQFEEKDEYWWLLMSIINHQHNLHIYLILSPNIVIRFDSNKFHKFWCSHLSRRIFIFLQNKTISNNELECTIAKSSSNWSKWIYYLPYSELGLKIYKFRK
jgi:hypothetical protein